MKRLLFTLGLSLLVLSLSAESKKDFGGRMFQCMKAACNESYGKEGFSVIGSSYGKDRLSVILQQESQEYLNMEPQVRCMAEQKLNAQCILVLTEWACPGTISFLLNEKISFSVTIEYAPNLSTDEVLEREDLKEFLNWIGENSNGDNREKNLHALNLLISIQKINCALPKEGTNFTLTELALDDDGRLTYNHVTESDFILTVMHHQHEEDPNYYTNMYLSPDMLPSYEIALAYGLDVKYKFVNPNHTDSLQIIIPKERIIEEQEYEANKTEDERYLEDNVPGLIENATSIQASMCLTSFRKKRMEISVPVNDSADSCYIVAVKNDKEQLKLLAMTNVRGLNALYLSRLRKTGSTIVVNFDYSQPFGPSATVASYTLSPSDYVRFITPNPDTLRLAERFARMRWCMSTSPERCGMTGKMPVHKKSNKLVSYHAEGIELKGNTVLLKMFLDTPNAASLIRGKEWANMLAYDIISRKANRFLFDALPNGRLILELRSNGKTIRSDGCTLYRSENFNFK